MRPGGCGDRRPQVRARVRRSRQGWRWPGCLRAWRMPAVTGWYLMDEHWTVPEAVTHVVALYAPDSGLPPVQRLRRGGVSRRHHLQVLTKSLFRAANTVGPPARPAPQRRPRASPTTPPAGTGHRTRSTTQSPSSNPPPTPSTAATPAPTDREAPRQLARRTNAGSARSPVPPASGCVEHPQ